MRIPFDTVKQTIKSALLNAGLSESQAETCAQIHTESSADGVESHGVNRIPRFIIYVKKGLVDIHSKIELVGAKGAVENYDAHRGIGILNGLFCADRVAELAKTHGIGCVALRNATHWMRGGTYAWRMAEKGFISMCWISTESCMPLWGSDEVGVGNNPFCMGVPRKDGPLVLDMSLSQFAYGKIGSYRLQGKQLPFPGGYDKAGNLTTDPASIEETLRILPTGYWKGSGMALAIDLASAAMANGKSGINIGQNSTDSCQIYIAYDAYLFGKEDAIQKMFNERIDAATASHPINDGGRVFYPGERALEERRRSAKEGVNVDEKIWEQIKSLSSGNLETLDISGI